MSPPHSELLSVIREEDEEEMKENQCMKVILERENQSKNPPVINKMGGANDANDTPVFVEAEANLSNRKRKKK